MRPAATCIANRVGTSPHGVGEAPGGRPLRYGDPAVLTGATARRRASSEVDGRGQVVGVRRDLTRGQRVRLRTTGLTQCIKLGLTRVETNRHSTLQVRHVEGRRAVSSPVGSAQHCEQTGVG